MDVTTIAGQHIVVPHAELRLHPENLRRFDEDIAGQYNCD
jgi:hypothetical protein